MIIKERRGEVQGKRESISLLPGDSEIMRRIERPGSTMPWAFYDLTRRDYFCDLTRRD
jgi:hypothetical protein